MVCGSHGCDSTPMNVSGQCTVALPRRVTYRGWGARNRDRSDPSGLEERSAAGDKADGSKSVTPIEWTPQSLPEQLVEECGAYTYQPYRVSTLPRSLVMAPWTEYRAHRPDGSECAIWSCRPE